ncbi:gastric triacylglycerol lipase [Cryptotermes secundus]|uniref:gastric triacylglycerol lipase n=1 Tax=Cryptotermes secundus TaxID=105785 RepID=UPI001454BF61|nr:gastric triacylglycerol lipase [Cryptotermes secundus]
MILAVWGKSLAYVCFLTLLLRGVTGKYNKNTRKSLPAMPKLITQHGYPAETHTVTTDDGYILTMHRIPYSPLSNSTDTARPVVFLQHGLISSSVDWVIMGPGNGLGYLLADAGYDVWMGNARGNMYSTRHNKLSAMLPTFWSFRYVKLHPVPSNIALLQKLRVAQEIPCLTIHCCVHHRVNHEAANPFHILLFSVYEIHFCIILNLYQGITNVQFTSFSGFSSHFLG